MSDIDQNFLDGLPNLDPGVPVDTGLPNLKELGGILPENAAALRNFSSITNIRNFSTQICEQTQPFDTQAIEGQVRARAATEEHLKLVSMAHGSNVEALANMTREFENIASSLASLRLPDTKVNVDGQKMEGGYGVKQYAAELDQDHFLMIVHKLLGTVRMDRLLAHCAKANMVHTAALWLNQALDYETQKNYVYTIAQMEPLSISKLEQALDADTKHKTSMVLKQILGPELYGKLQRCSDSQQTSVYVMYVVLIDKIFNDLGGKYALKTVGTIWDKVTSPKHVEHRPEVTAAYAERMKQ